MVILCFVIFEDDIFGRSHMFTSLVQPQIRDWRKWYREWSKGLDYHVIAGELFAGTVSSKCRLVSYPCNLQNNVFWYWGISFKLHLVSNNVTFTSKVFARLMKVNVGWCKRQYSVYKAVVTFQTSVSNQHVVNNVLYTIVSDVSREA